MAVTYQVSGKFRCAYATVNGAAARVRPYATAPKLNAFNLVTAGPLLEPNKSIPRYGNHSAGRGSEFHSGPATAETNSQMIRLAKVLAQ